MPNLYKKPGTRLDLQPETRKFLADWLAWHDRGAPDHKPYERAYGLCSAARAYDKHGNVLDDLEQAFESCTGDPNYPFGEAEFNDVPEIHNDRRRLAFVRANLP